MTQERLPYFGRAPHVVGSDTSQSAGESIEPSACVLRERVYLCIADGGATCDEVEQRTGLRHQTASARVRELALSGRIRDTGQRRKTRSGRNAAVWVAS